MAARRVGRWSNSIATGHAGIILARDARGCPPQGRNPAMTGIVRFIKATLLGGLFVVLPVVLLYLVALKALQLAVKFSTPIAAVVPAGLSPVKSPLLIAAVLIVGASFLVGLAMRSAPARRLGRRVEMETLGRFPPYKFLKGMTGAMAGGCGRAGIQPRAAGAAERNPVVCPDHRGARRRGCDRVRPLRPDADDRDRADCHARPPAASECKRWRGAAGAGQLGHRRSQPAREGAGQPRAAVRRRSSCGLRSRSIVGGR